MPPRLALVAHPDCQRHDTGAGHLESADRLPALLSAVHADAELRRALVDARGVPVAESDLLRVHSRELVTAIRGAAAEAQRSGHAVWLDADTAVSPGSWDAALAAAGCVLTAAELVLDGAAAAAFALSRPPGHHATRDRAMGFCLVNNVAVAVRALQARGRIARALVVDWDAHHGNGTQDVFYDDPSVYVLSLHLAPAYPGTGAAEERGEGAAQGTTRNVPLPAGTRGAEYRRRHAEALEEAVARFAPDLVVVSAGFDVLAGDPEGGLSLEPDDLHALATDLLARLPASTGGRVVAALEGGYDPARIGAGLVAVLRAFGGLPAPARGAG